MIDKVGWRLVWNKENKIVRELWQLCVNYTLIFFKLPTHSYATKLPKPNLGTYCWACCWRLCSSSIIFFFFTEPEWNRPPSPRILFMAWRCLDSWRYFCNFQNSPFNFQTHLLSDSLNPHLGQWKMSICLNSTW